MWDDYLVVKDEEHAVRLRRGIADGDTDYGKLAEIIDRRALEGAMADTRKELVSHRQSDFEG